MFIGTDLEKIGLKLEKKTEKSKLGVVQEVMDGTKNKKIERRKVRRMTV